ncbi:FMN reductase (NADH) RutF [uncultured archaeon]|nr:FMN reductase (NADH) RutF [uncultured archaeon]
MDLGYGNEKAGKFVTNVGLVTTDGPNGPNIMAAEWTYYVSWSPALISVHIGGGSVGKATAENITKSKEFGVSIASEGQNVLSSIAGGSSGREVSKIPLLKEMGFAFRPAKKIKVQMPDGAASYAECRLLEAKQLGDHTMFIGEVLEIESDAGKKPLAYSAGKYYHLGEQIHKPAQDVLDRIAALKEKHRKK